MASAICAWNQYNKGQVKKQFVVPVAGPLEQLGS
jgi:hypothetical protein